VGWESRTLPDLHLAPSGLLGAFCYVGRPLSLDFHFVGLIRFAAKPERAVSMLRAGTAHAHKDWFQHIAQ
jgi:hypothetical protein